MSAENKATAPSAEAAQPFELDKLRELITLMEKHGLSEVDLRKGDQRWKLRRGPAEIMQMVSPAAFAPPPPMPYPGLPSGAPPAPTQAEHSAGETIKSPTVGTFYESPSPGDPPFVTVGARVTPDSVVCIIEAMKVFNQITADVNATITEILVKNGDAVEFGQPLFRIRLG